MSLVNKISQFFNKDKSSKTKCEGKISDYVGKFVKQNNTEMGESVALEEGRIIVKSSDGFLSIPLEAVVANIENIVVGDFNKEESLKLGREWFERKDVLKFDKDGMLVK